MHSHAIRADALDLIDAGENDCEVARRLGLPRTTVRDWRLPRSSGSRLDHGQSMSEVLALVA